MSRCGRLEPFKEDIISSYLSGNSSCVICKLYNVTPNMNWAGIK